MRYPSLLLVLLLFPVLVVGGGGETIPVQPTKKKDFSSTVFQGVKQSAKSPTPLGGTITLKGKAFEKIVLVSDSKGAIDWDYDEDSFPESRSEVCHGEKKLVLFPISAGQYRVRLLLWEEKRFQKYILVVEGSTPPVPPIVPPVIPPIVPPQPPPVVDTFGLVALSRSELVKLSLDVRGLAPALADNFEAVSAMMAATSGMQADAANAELKKRNGVTLGANAQYWRPWFDAWKVRVDNLYDTGKVRTRDDHITVLRETAAGLRVK